MNEFEIPKVYIIKADALSISGNALIDLMQAVFEKGMSLRFKAKGYSMIPFIKDGDVITIKPYLNNSPRFGDVVAYVHPQSEILLVHRIIHKQGKAFLIQGDNLPDRPDGKIDMHRMLGSVIQIERNNKKSTFGLGPERLMIAWLSRMNLLIPSQRILFKFIKR